MAFVGLGELVNDGYSTQCPLSDPGCVTDDDLVSATRACDDVEDVLSDLSANENFANDAPAYGISAAMGKPMFPCAPSQCVAPRRVTFSNDEIEIIPT